MHLFKYYVLIRDMFKNEYNIFMVCENSHYIKAKHIIKKNKMHTKSLFRLKDFTLSTEVLSTISGKK